MDSIIKEFKLKHSFYNGQIHIDTDDIKYKLHVPAELCTEPDTGSTELLKILKTLNTHPEHTNINCILNPDFECNNNDYILASIYKVFRHQYNIVHQYPKFELKNNVMIEINPNNGLIIELGVKDERTAEECENKRLRLALDGFRYMCVIQEEEVDEKMINGMVDKIREEIKECEMVYCADVKPDELLNMSQQFSIERDFYNVTGKSIVSNKKYCIEFDDVVTYSGYVKHSAYRVLLDNFSHDYDYINENSNIILTRETLYNFILISDTSKGDTIRKWFGSRDYNKLLTFVKHNVEVKNQEGVNELAVCKRKIQDDYDMSYVLMRHELKTSKELLEESNKKKTQYEQLYKNTVSTISIYKEMCNGYVKELEGKNELIKKYEANNKVVCAIIEHMLTLNDDGKRKMYKDLINKIIMC
jgi:hypothetical protein